MTYSVERLTIAKIYIFEAFQKKYPQKFPPLQNAFEDELNFLFEAIQKRNPKDFHFSESNPQMSQLVTWVHTHIGPFPENCSLYLSRDRDFGDQHLDSALYKAKKNLKSKLIN